MGVIEETNVRQLPTAAETGAMNMALDAVAAETVAQGGPASVRVYEWSPSTLSLGYAQDPKTVDWRFCDREGIEVTRRPTGGGGIYHDAVGDISYSIVASRSELPGDLMECYELLCQPILEAFDAMGADVRFATSERLAAHEPSCYLRGLHPSHDLVVSEPDGERKISGNAQHRPRDAVIQHGSLLFRNLPERHMACFVSEDADPDVYRERVTAIEEQSDIDRHVAIDSLETTLGDWFDASPGEWRAAERDRARELVAEKFGAEDWIRRRVDPVAEG